MFSKKRLKDWKCVSASFFFLCQVTTCQPSSDDTVATWTRRPCLTDWLLWISPRWKGGKGGHTKCQLHSSFHTYLVTHQETVCVWWRGRNRKLACLWGPLSKISVYLFYDCRIFCKDIPTWPLGSPINESSVLSGTLNSCYHYVWPCCGCVWL